MNPFLFSDIKNGNVKINLKKTETKGEVVDLARILATEPAKGQQDITRNYFFQAGVDEWYDNLKTQTFLSAFVPISTDEAQSIIQHWQNVSSLSEGPFEVPLDLFDLVQRIDKTKSDIFPNTERVFVKLSTRSPKDSKTVLRKASLKYHERFASSVEENVSSPETQDNARLVAMCEEMVQAAAVSNGQEAVTILCDSWRVAEDLMYAYEEGKDAVALSLVIREWNPRITPQCEFRGFVWDRRLTCIGQYWHSLYLPELESIKEQVARDCLALFDTLKTSLPVPNAMLDLAWLGPGEVILIEVNPLMEGLGSFKGSTGLFDFYEDAEVLTGRSPFEIRLRSKPETRAELVSHMSLEWRSVVFGY
jgi:hypothetical protein